MGSGWEVDSNSQAAPISQHFPHRSEARGGTDQNRPTRKQVNQAGIHELEEGTSAKAALDVGAASGNETLLGSYRRLLEQTQRRTVALATAAHELKTPLAVLSGYLELLHGSELGLLNERQQQVLTEARLNCARLQRFIQDFLTYSALETGKFTLKLERSDLNACLSELYGFWLARFRAKGVALFFPINSRLGPFYFDPYKIQQVVSNLLENALRLTPAGGTVWLSAEPHWWERRVALPDTVQAERRNQQTAAANAVRISVADTGPGIPPEYHQEIFDDFFRLGDAGDGSEGTGLGLGIARRLVQAHGGKIWVESASGHGSKFSLFLPQSPVEPVSGVGG